MKDQPPRILAKLLQDDPFFEIIEDAYKAFDFPKPSRTEVCDCCMDRRIESDFFNPPIRELPLEYIRDQYFSAANASHIAKPTWAYLLPRILEILAAGEYVTNVALEISLSRFDTGNKGNWSPSQWSVLDRFQRKYLERHIKEGIGELDVILCMFRRGGWPLADLLDQVTASSDAILAQRLWLDWCHANAPYCERVHVTAFWEGAEHFWMVRSLNN